MAHLKTAYDIVRQWDIYKITSPSNRVYVGLTLDIKRRENDYKKHACKNQVLLYRSLLKYGFNSHKFQIIDSFESNTDYAYGKEISFIKSNMCNRSKYPENDGLNSVGGGRGSIGRKMSDETKEKIRQANLGKKYSDETKKKLSEQRQGKKIKSGWTDEKKDALRKKKIGFRHTNETKYKISASQIGHKRGVGKKQTQEHIDKRIAYLIGHKFNVGRKFTEAHKKAISDSHKGKIVPQETIDKSLKTRGDIVGKTISQYSLDGVFIQDFISIRSASRELNMNRIAIGNIVSGKTRSPKYFIFKNK